MSKRLTFGTPSYPSPLDRIRGGRYERADQLGLLTGKEASFEGNQSYPKINRGQLCLDVTMTKPKTTKILNSGKIRFETVVKMLQSLSFSIYRENVFLL
jgi:hypothetical protein